MEKGSATSLWKEGGSFCCSDVVVVIVFGEEVFDIFDGVSVVLCKNRWNVFKKDNGSVVDGGGLQK